eukprot:CAMPEP_0197518292 /NCGR_PEP_ID=MMETSP1318-20131121/3464_1 /TAXON_ID=552666 /ORGANISM="Partenskyella glossopodia, Strain RCC365" /LENGTH=229 /DNA_ID=CAMNT_0043068519 /DNA_START=364 /DNA_END=1054 /DNA_ORIENTATION=-
MDEIGRNSGDVEYAHVKHWVGEMIKQGISPQTSDTEKVIQCLENDNSTDLSLEAHSTVQDVPVSTKVNDLSVAVFESLINGIFLGEDSIPAKPASTVTPVTHCVERRCALEKWVSILHTTLPGFEGLKAASDYLTQHANKAISRQEWLEVLGNSTQSGIPGNIVFTEPNRGKYSVCAGEAMDFLAVYGKFSMLSLYIQLIIPRYTTYKVSDSTLGIYSFADNAKCISLQ